MKYTSAPQNKDKYQKTQRTAPKTKEETLQNQFSKGKVKPEVNTSPMTNIR